MKTDISAKFGFGLRTRMQALKLEFDAAGAQGQISFVKATVRSGTTKIEKVIEEVTRLTGGHIYSEIEDLIYAQMGVHWTQTVNGGLHVIAE
ncbi:hypothetical protein [Qipengyuania nanhaisediminis]|uniref:Uncharacterized protein n=1 Tax=Qipengyuania nanhaisediminis TaxID=604088 RepID=A0A1I5KAR8_9SPHN|nr:hypothetical protein [Qipengyuania nanhaisediminis]SFO81711.1 hypothetical protein SAMN04488060_0021 [Qipengyuania nanhaisediminis]